jgi:hypothetical protein
MFIFKILKNGHPDNILSMKMMMTMGMRMMRKRINLTSLQDHYREKVTCKVLTKLGTSIFKKDASNGLSHERMLYTVDKSHPRITIKDPLCKS